MHQPMVTNEPQNEEINTKISALSNPMNISVAFKEIVSKNPSRYTDLCDTVNKTFKEISDVITVEEFKNLLGDISFSKNKKNVTNLLSTLKTQFYNHMSKSFEQLIKEENLSELFAKKDLLSDEEAKKYLIDDDFMELYELEESLHQLDTQISDLEQTNEILFNQGNFNQQRYDILTKRITNIITECETKYKNCQEVTDVIRKELIKLIENIKWY